MPWRTPLDRVFNQKVLFYAFVGIIVGTTAITLFTDTRIGNPELRKDKVFDPKSHDPENWSINDLKKWLRQRDIHYESAELRNDLVVRVKNAMEATERREHTEFAETDETVKPVKGEEIEMDELGSATGKVNAK